MQAVVLAGGGADGNALCVEVEFLAVAAHPTNAPRGITHHQCERRHIFRYHGACTDEAVCPQTVSANDGGIGTHRRAALDDGLAVLSLAADCGARVEHIGEHHARTEEYIVLATHTCIDRHIVLYLAVPAQHHIGRDNDVLPDVAVLADGAARHHMAEMPNLGALAYAAPLINIR